MSDSDSELDEWVNSYTSKSLITAFKNKTITPSFSLVTPKLATDLPSHGTDCQINSDEKLLPSLIPPVIATSEPTNHSDCQIDDSQAEIIYSSVPPAKSNLELISNNSDRSSATLCAASTSISNNIVLSKSPTIIHGRRNSGQNNIVELDTRRHSYNTRSNRKGNAPVDDVSNQVLVVSIDEDSECDSTIEKNKKQRVNKGRNKRKSTKKTPLPSNTVRGRLSIEPISVEVESNKYLEDIEQENLNYETSIKVLWKSVNVIRIPIRRFQKLSNVFSHLMKEENVTSDQIVLTFRGVPVKQSDTPDSLNLAICDFLEGGVVKRAMAMATTEVESNKKKKGEFFLNFQYGDKKMISLTTKINEAMKKVMLLFSEQIETPFSSIIFQVDGEEISGTDTPESLDLGKGDIIDVLFA